MNSYTEIAEKVLKRLNSFVKSDNIEKECALISYGENTFLAIVQSPCKNDKEIVFVDKTDYSIEQEMVDAIRQLNPDITVLNADSEMDITGKRYVLRKIGGRLTYLTHDQDEFVASSEIVLLSKHYN